MSSPWSAPWQAWVVLAGALLNVAVFYWFPVREWFLRWGATSEDLERVMPGDADVSAPTYLTTLAVTIDARPEHIWPWLLQMGHKRGGLYSYDWLDRLFGFLDRPSANEILPEFQHLKTGDEIPMGRGSGFPVRAVIPNRALVLGGAADGFTWIWQLGLYPLGDSRTRLVSRNAAVVPSTLGAWLFMRILEPAAFIMTRRMLLGIKRRAEALERTERRHPSRAA
jgi:hypothetical protein